MVVHEFQISTHLRFEIVRDSIRTALSLAAAIQEAGGSIRSVIDDFNQKTMMDFLVEVAVPNDIQFKYLHPDRVPTTTEEAIDAV